MAEPFDPAPFQVVSEPQQLKAFTDPLRYRVLQQLKDRPRTNQQVAAALDVPQARALHHVRSLLDAGLIRLVEQRVRGGNVEKYYRATALLYGLRPGPDDQTAVSSVVLGAVLADLAQAEARFPDAPTDWEIRRARFTPARRQEFRDRLNALIGEYWGGPDGPVDDDPDGEPLAFASILYQAPTSGAGDRADDLPARDDEVEAAPGDVSGPGTDR